MYLSPIAATWHRRTGGKVPQVLVAIVVASAVLSYFSSPPLARADGPALYVDTIAGSGTTGMLYGPAATAQFNSPLSPVFDSHGNLFFIDQNNQHVSKLTPGGVVSILAGTGSGWPPQLNDGPGESATFSWPLGMAIDSDNNLYVADINNGAVRKVAPDGTVSTISGTSGHGYVFSVAFDSERQVLYFGTVYFGSVNGGAYKRTADGTVTQIGSWTTQGYYPQGMALDSHGNLYMAMVSTNTIMKVTPDGTSTVFAGSGVAGYLDGQGTSAKLNSPYYLAVDPSDNVYFTEAGSPFHIRKITPGGLVSTVLNANTTGSLDNDGQVAQVASSGGLVTDKVGNLFVADVNSNRIRKVTFAPTITAVTPATGPAAGGTTITITGTGFMAGSTVKVGDSAATVTSINTAGTQIVATTPAGTGNSSVTVSLASTPQFTTYLNAFAYAAEATQGSAGAASGTVTGSVSIGAPGQLPGEVLLSLSASESTGASVTQMMLSNAADFTGASWEPFAATKAWKLAASSPVYVKFRTASDGVESPVYTLTPKALRLSLSSFGTVNFTPSISNWYYTGHHPEFKGKSDPGAKVQVIIHSDPIYCTVTADANGTWACTPDKDLPDGDHTITIQSVGTNGAFASFGFKLGINTGLAATGQDTHVVGGVSLITGIMTLWWFARRRTTRTLGY